MNAKKDEPQPDTVVGLEPQPQPTPPALPVFGDVYASRPAAPEGDPDQARSDAAAQLPGRLPGNVGRTLDEKKIRQMFEEVLAPFTKIRERIESQVAEEEDRLHGRVDELEAQLAAAQSDLTDRAADLEALEAQLADKTEPKAKPKKGK